MPLTAAGGAAEALRHILARRFQEEQARIAHEQRARQFGLQEQQLGENVRLREAQQAATGEQQQFARQLGLAQLQRATAAPHEQRQFLGEQSRQQREFLAEQNRLNRQNQLTIAGMRQSGQSGNQEAQRAFQAERAKRGADMADDLSKRVSGLTVGAAGLTSIVPGTPAADFASDLDALKSNIAFSELQAMRNASKTGGALGQVSNIELNLLSSALGGLSQRQSPTQMKQRLEAIRDSLQRWEIAKKKFGGTLRVLSIEEVK